MPSRKPSNKPNGSAATRPTPASPAPPSPPDTRRRLFQVECLTRTELGTALHLARRYRDLRLGLADASLVVLAQRLNTRRVVTLDERAFRTIAPLQAAYSRSCPKTAERTSEGG
ncbi:MAG TPA: PIN domain-containing protein [Chloroflexota bacterium]|nr:PIN domain-containing protein [Chloroflexota bacterium]